MARFQLSPFQEALLLALFPTGTRIQATRMFQPEYPPSPVRVELALADGEQRAVVLRLSRNPAAVAPEARLFQALALIGLPVPTVLAGPVSDPTAAHDEPQVVLSLLPGVDLQHLSLSSPADLLRAKDLVIEAVAWLHRLTPAVAASSIAADIPRVTLGAELNAVFLRGGPWLQEPEFQEAVHQLAPALDAIKTPLVFSNGDYQPANFLTDGQTLTGFVDFEQARFEDPHYGFAKYLVYDMDPLNDAGLVEHYLDRSGVSKREFAPRMAVRCLWTLQREVAVRGGNQKMAQYRTAVLELLHAATSEIHSK